MNSVDIKETRAKLVANARVIIDAADTDARDLTADEQTQVDAMFTQADQLAQQASNAERKEKLEVAEADLKRSAGRKTSPNSLSVAGYDAADRKKALRSWALYGTEHADVSGSVRAAAEHFAINLGSRTLSIADLSKRTLVKGTASAGGNLVPTDLMTEIIRKTQYFSPIRQLAKNLVTDGGNPIEWPSVDDTAAATIVGEVGTIPTGPDPVFGKKALGAWKYASGIVRCSIELLQDSAVDMESLLADLFADRMARGQEPHFITGNGTTQPEGLATAATVAVTLATGNPLTFDKIFDLIYAVDRTARQSGAFLLHDTMLAGLRKLKDSTGNYIWQPSVVATEPDRIFGYPVYVSNYMTDYGTPGTGQPLALFGDFSKYLIRDVSPSFQIKRLDEVFAVTGEVGFVMLQRTDAKWLGASNQLAVLKSF